MATCPECGAVSGRIHSRYRRRLVDLPAHGRIVEINVETRRFRCVGIGCRRRIFVQRLGDAVALPSARRTARMDGIVHRLGLALGGRPGHNLASRLAIPVSKDTLLRTVRRRTARPRDPLRTRRSWAVSAIRSAPAQALAVSDRSGIGLASIARGEAGPH